MPASGGRSLAINSSGVKHLAIYGVCGGVLIVAMRFVEYRFLVVSHSVEIYAALIAAALRGGRHLARPDHHRPEGRGQRSDRRSAGPGIVRAVRAPIQARIEALGITPRELEVLQLIAEGLSNKEMAERLFVSENTIKTHTSRVFDKLGASRRTQAVQLAKSQGLIA